MRINEIASAEEQMGLWKLVSDNVWQAISTQAEQEARAKAEKAAAAKSRRSKRGGGRKSVSKSAGPVAMPLPKISAPPPKASDAKAADAASKQANKTAQQLPLPQSQGPLPRLGAAQVAKLQAAQQILPAPLPPNSAMPQRPKTAVLPAQTARPKLSARYGGMVAGDTPI
jgi:hypothetical protein